MQTSGKPVEFQFVGVYKKKGGGKEGRMAILIFIVCS